MTEGSTEAGGRVVSQVVNALDNKLRVDVVVAGLPNPLRVTAATSKNLTVEIVSHGVTYYVQTSAIICAIVRAASEPTPASEPPEMDPRVRFTEYGS